MSPDDRLREPPRERLGAAVQRIALAEAAAKLRAEPHASVGGHRQVALVKHGSLSVVLFAFERGGGLKDHRATGEVTIHVLTGRLEIPLATGPVTLGAGELLALAPGETHAVRALEPSEMLLTVCLSR